ncbi:MAG: phage tail protein [Acidimicrobiia bacterium]
MDPKATGTSEKLMRGSLFAIEVDSVNLAFFQDCGGLGSSNEVIEHRVVSATGQVVVQKMPGQLKWGDVTLKKSLTDEKALTDWRQQVEEGKFDSYRRNGSIVVYDPQMTEIARWNFINGWPSEWKGSDLSSGGDDVMTEEITIAHEGITRA